jgi:predicted DNA-binding protein with PD1-like motif
MDAKIFTKTLRWTFMEETSQYLEGIGHGRIGRIVVGKFKIGVDLLEGIEELAKTESIRTGAILSGIGALEKGVFRNAKVMPPNYKMEDKYRLFVDVEKPLELVSLSGWIAPLSEGNLNIHAHFLATTVVDDKIVSLGGHLTKGTITSIKVVVVIGAIEDTNINAALDPTINQVNLDFVDKYHSLHDFNK